MTTARSSHTSGYAKGKAQGNRFSEELEKYAKGMEPKVLLKKRKSFLFINSS